MDAGDGTGPVLEHLPARDVPLGGPRSMTVRRALPGRDRRTVGAWCFLDHYGPGLVGHRWRMDVPPHPHTGLQTVSWLLEGEILHRDSLGSEALVRPGELNLMTSGRGISHSEESVGEGALLGVQLWVALPDADRRQDPHFEHHGDLPRLELPGAQVRVVVGAYAGEVSPALVYTPLVALEVRLDRTAVLALEPAYEHAVLLADGVAEVEGEPLVPGSLLYLGTGRSALALAGDPGSRLLVVGGTPFDEELVMWWNFVGRSHDEVARDREEWQRAADRFGAVPAYGGDRLLAPELPRVELKPRPRVRAARR